ncbi:MAG: formylglycine-generating enzyme family protein [Planctomycetota bacterium]|nr:formylglycine-generating enzyme family protein [Planctomycetota bacterium]
MNRQRTAALILIVVLAGSRLARSDQPEVSTNPVITNSVGLKLAHIPAGTFVMGSPRSEAERDDKEERHEVTITKPFYLGVYEVTQAEYVKVMRGTGLPDDRSTFKGDNLPAENVEWRVTQIFCEQLSARPEEVAAKRKYRLPTEAEWEYACRAGSSTAFHFGDSLSSDQANFNGEFPAGDGEQGKYLRTTVAVGSYPPNAFGLYDMHGNVAEWCADWYDPEYYLNSPEEDPLGPPFGIVDTKFTNNGNENFFVVIRGGCWVDEGRGCRAAYRYRAMPNTQYRLIGFRVACGVEGE